MLSARRPACQGVAAGGVCCEKRCSSTLDSVVTLQLHTPDVRAAFRLCVRAAQDVNTISNALAHGTMGQGLRQVGLADMAAAKNERAGRANLNTA